MAKIEIEMDEKQGNKVGLSVTTWEDGLPVVYHCELGMDRKGMYIECNNQKRYVDGEDITADLIDGFRLKVSSR